MICLALLGLALVSCGAEKGADQEEATKTDAAAKPTTDKGEEKEPSETTLSPAEQQSAGIALGRVLNRQLGTGLSVSGTLDVPPESAVAVATPLGGFVQSTDLLQGTYVRKGAGAGHYPQP